MATSTVEDYVKEIFLAQQRKAVNTVPMGLVAKALNVAPGTATTMIKSLAQADLAEYEPRKGVTLTAKGRELALSMIRRHRILELFLVNVLGLDWTEIHSEAERLEHAISDRVLERMDVLLGKPTIDPHGDPIPLADGTFDDRRLENLSNCSLARKYRVSRIADQSEAFLNLVESSNLKPGVEIEIIERNRASGVIWIRVREGDLITLGLSAAEKIYVD